MSNRFPMNRLTLLPLFFTALFLLSSCNRIDWSDLKEEVNKEREKEDDPVNYSLLGIDIPGDGQFAFYPIDPLSKQIGDKSSMRGEKYYRLGELSYDGRANLMTLGLTDGTSLYNTKEEKIIAKGIDMQLCEVDARRGKIYGLLGPDNETYFASYDIKTKELSRHLKLDASGGIRAGMSTFSREKGLYFIEFSNGVNVIDVDVPKLIKRIEGIVNVEYDSKNARLIGLLEGENGTLAEANLRTGKVNSLFDLPSFRHYVSGHSSFDAENGYYLLGTGNSFSVYSVNRPTLHWTIERAQIDFLELAN